MARGDKLNPGQSTETATKAANKPVSDSEVLEASAVDNGDGKVAIEVFNSESSVIPGLSIPKHDEIVLTYVAAGNGAGEIQTAVYKLAAVVVATVTIAYNGDDKISNVTIVY